MSQLKKDPIHSVSLAVVNGHSSSYV